LKLNWSFLRLAALCILALPVAGCGGVNASGTVSPLIFFLKNDSKPATGAPVVATNSATPAKELAKTN
jgi:hypothetical protein